MFRQSGVFKSKHTWRYKFGRLHFRLTCFNWKRLCLLKLPKGINVQGLIKFLSYGEVTLFYCSLRAKCVSGLVVTLILCHWDITLNLSLLIRLRDWPFWYWFRERLGRGCFELHCGAVLGTNFYSHSCASLQKSRGNITVYRQWVKEKNFPLLLQELMRFWWTHLKYQ